MKIIYNIQHVILRFMLCGSMVSSVLGCTSLSARRNLDHSDCAVLKSLNPLPLKDIVAAQIIRSFLVFESKKKSKNWQVEYLIHALVKYFKQVQQYLNDLKLPISIKNKCFPSFIAYYAKYVNVLKPSEGLFGNHRSVAPLHRATAKANLPLMQQLVAYGADVNIRDSDGCTPLHIIALSCKKGAAQVRNFLSSRGADPNITNYAGYTALDLQARKEVQIGSGVLTFCFCCLAYFLL